MGRVRTYTAKRDAQNVSNVYTLRPPICDVSYVRTIAKIPILRHVSHWTRFWSAVLDNSRKAEAADDIERPSRMTFYVQFSEDHDGE